MIAGPLTNAQVALIAAVEAQNKGQNENPAAIIQYATAYANWLDDRDTHV